MSRHHVLVKVYGNLYPASSALFASLADCCRGGCVTESDDIPVVELCGDLLRISYEGMFFPLDDVLERLLPFLTSAMQGKIDYIDVEAWTLTRHTITGTCLHVSSAPINNVMDYSGL